MYLFLIGMMLLAEVARSGEIFGWLGQRAVAAAGGSRLRLFALVYGAGICTTALLSNDATIVLLTPAVIDALRRVDAPPTAYVIACALVANAASLTLPIANPANLLVYAGRMPALASWLATFTVPSIAALGVTFGVLVWCYRRDLAGTWPMGIDPEPGTLPSRPIGMAVVLATVAIVFTSARNGPLGTATFVAAVAAWVIAIAVRGRGALGMIRRLSWPVVALTAMLFVIVSALDTHGGFALTRALITGCSRLPSPWSHVALGFAAGAISNVVNNLPVGLNLGETLPALHVPPALTASALIGVNVGPSATITGSLATLLWLGIVRRAGIAISALAFMGVGALATVPALLAALITVR